MAATNPRLAARARTSRETVVPWGFAFQIAFNADCISPNTPEAVMSRVVAPTTEARMPLDLPDAQDAPRVLWVGGAVLVVAVGGGPGPMRVCPQRRQPLNGRVQPQVANRTAREAPHHRRVIDEECVEDR